MIKAQKKLSVGFLFDDTLDSNDGVAQYVKNLGSWLSNHGHRVTYMVGSSKTSSWDGGKVWPLSHNLRLIWAGNRLSISIVPKLKAINLALKDGDFDIIHVQAPYSPFMSQIVINKAGPEVALVGTFHVFPANKIVFIGSRLLRMAYGKSLKRFDQWLSVSPAASSYAKAAFGQATLASSNVVELGRFSAANSAPVKNHIVFLGRLVRRKGALELLRAFKLLHRQIPQARLTIAGDGPLRSKLEKFVYKNNLEGFVTFLGYIDEKDKPKILASAEIACFPSLYGESFGIVLIEAMAAGAHVVIGGNNPGYASVLGQCPQTLVNPRQTKEFAALLQKFLTDENLSADVHHWQQEHVKQYDVEKVGPKIISIYHEAIDKRLQKRHN